MCIYCHYIPSYSSQLFSETMSKNLSDPTPLRSSDKKSIKRLPLDDRFITPTFDAVGPRLGKFVSQDDQCIIFHQVRSVLLILKVTSNTSSLEQCQ